MRIAVAFIIGVLVTSVIWPQDRNRGVHQTVPEKDQDDVVRINTRVVFVDVLVKDKRTNQPVSGLTADDFEILDNGRPRPISYFSREGNDRHRPLALLLILAPLDNDDRKDFQRPEIVNSLKTALNKLPPEDEVAVVLVWRDGDAHMLTELTRDRREVAAALENLPKSSNNKPFEKSIKIIQNLALSTAAQRPNSWVNAVLISDSVYLIEHKDRDALGTSLIRANVSFNALISGTDKFFKLFYPLLRAGEQAGVSWFDVPQYLAKHTGGDFVRPRNKQDYGRALERLIGNLTARYSLGFRLTEDELDDGQMNRLEVRVKSRDSQGKDRTLEVRARSGYYRRKQ